MEKEELVGNKTSMEKGESSWRQRKIEAKSKRYSYEVSILINLTEF